MARKRPRIFADAFVSDDSGGSDYEVDEHEIPNDHIGGVSFSEEENDDGSNSSDSEVLKSALYQKYKEQYNKVKKIEKEMLRALNHEDKRAKPVIEKKKDAFTRFSASYFSKVIDSLDENKRSIIEKHGFGSLIEFDKCFVPNKFAMWVAQPIDYRSGDIIVKDKVISLIEDAVHYVLDLPMGCIEFPIDYSSGKSRLLSQFNLQSLPPAKYFGDMLIDKKPVMDEEAVTCFLIVALNCFPCPNCSVTPSNRYLGIFEDINNVRKYNWCSFVRSWLLERIKSFNKTKFSADDPPSLGGCLYLIAVMYLDFVNCNARQPSLQIPRILVWKGTMLRDFSDLDLVSTGVYGFRPLLEISATCYSKQSIFLHTSASSASMNSEFKNKLDEYSQCKLPEKLKTGICKAIEEHCFNSSLSVNMDITSLASLSSDLEQTFSTLLEHVYSVDSRSMMLVLKVIGLIAENGPAVSEASHQTSEQNTTPESDVRNYSTPHMRGAQTV